MTKLDAFSRINSHYNLMAKLDKRFPTKRKKGSWVHIAVLTEKTGACRTETLALCGKQTQSYKMRTSDNIELVTCPRCKALSKERTETQHG